MPAVFSTFKKHIINIDVSKVAKIVIEENTLQRNTIATRKREFSEIKKRLQTLTSNELHYFATSSSEEAKQLAMLSCFKLYRLIYEFAAEVLQEKILLFDMRILDSDYNSFLESKKVSSQKLATISETTQNKIKQVMFKIFEQANFIDSVKTKNIQRPHLSHEVIKLILEDDPLLLRAFLMRDSEIKLYKEQLR
jgi:hypothetical protein